MYVILGEQQLDCGLLPNRRVFLACVMVLQSFLIRIKGCCCVVFRGHRLQQPNAGGPSEVSERHIVGRKWKSYSRRTGGARRISNWTNKVGFKENN